MGLTALQARLAPGGVLGMWAAARRPTFEATRAQHFTTVQRREVPVARGEPDVRSLAEGTPPTVRSA